MDLQFCRTAFKHGLSIDDFFDSFEDQRSFIRKSSGATYEMLASNRGGSIFHIAYKRMPGCVLIFHGRRATLVEKRRYLNRGK